MGNVGERASTIYEETQTAAFGACVQARSAAGCGPGDVDKKKSRGATFTSRTPAPLSSTSVDLPNTVDKEKDDEFGLGILWLTRNSKLIVAGFAPGSAARTAGVKSGDILKSVNGLDVLGMTVNKATGKHEAGALMVGAFGSNCELELLRVPQAVDGQSPDTQTTLQHVVAKVPRLLPTEAFTTQHF